MNHPITHRNVEIFMDLYYKCLCWILRIFATEKMGLLRT